MYCSILCLSRVEDSFCMTSSRQNDSSSMNASILILSAKSQNNLNSFFSIKFIAMIPTSAEAMQSRIVQTNYERYINN